MHIRLISVGKLKAGPERELVTRYLTRAKATGRRAGLSGFETTEIPESRDASPISRKQREAKAVLSACPPEASWIILEETGKTRTSRQLANHVARLNDNGTKNLCLIIGGPDGLDKTLLGKADLVLSLSSLTWPHQIVRIMLAEQVYRLTSILVGHPYHRD